MFAPRGYTALPQDAIDEEDENELHASINESPTSPLLNRDHSNMDHSSGSLDKEDPEKDTRRKQTRVRFAAKSSEDEQEALSYTRRICFVLSLMICTLTIFVFAFTVPCKRASCTVTNMVPPTTDERLKLHSNWSMSFPGHSSHAGITFHDGVRNAEVIVSYKNVGNKPSKKRENLSAYNNGGLLSLNGKNGELVWRYNASLAKKIIVCESGINKSDNCIIESSHGTLQLVSPKHNEIIWSTSVAIDSVLPNIITSIVDCDGDGETDLFLSYDRVNASRLETGNKTNSSYTPGQIQVISGKTGHRIGRVLTIPQTHLIKRVSLHATNRETNIIFVMTVGTQGDVQVVPVKRLYEKIREAKPGVYITDLFNQTKVQLSRVVSLNHPPVVKDINEDFVDDIVLVTLAGNKHSLTAVDGGSWAKIWRITFGSRKLLSSPVIGHFNNDNVPDILVVLQDLDLQELNQSFIQILNGKNGKILWSRKLKVAVGTSPLSVNIRHKRDVFFIWIEKEKVQEFVNIVPLKKQGIRLFDTGENSSGKTQGNETRHRPRKRRDETPSLENDEKIKSSMKEMEEELDELIEEAKRIESNPTIVTEIPTKQTEKNVLKMLQRIDERETVTQSPRKNTNERKLSLKEIVTKKFDSKENTEKKTTETEVSTEETNNNIKKVLTDKKEYKATTTHYQPTPTTSSGLSVKQESKGSTLGNKIKNSQKLTSDGSSLKNEKTGFDQDSKKKSFLKNELKLFGKTSGKTTPLKRQETFGESFDNITSNKMEKSQETAYDIHTLGNQNSLKERNLGSISNGTKTTPRVVANVHHLTRHTNFAIVPNRKNATGKKNGILQGEAVKTTLEEPKRNINSNKSTEINLKTTSHPTFSSNTIKVSLRTSNHGENSENKTNRTTIDSINVKKVVIEKRNESSAINEQNARPKKTTKGSTSLTMLNYTNPQSNPENTSLNLGTEAKKEMVNTISNVSTSLKKSFVENGSNTTRYFQKDNRTELTDHVNTTGKGNDSKNEGQSGRQNKLTRTKLAEIKEGKTNQSTNEWVNNTSKLMSENFNNTTMKPHLDLTSNKSDTNINVSSAVVNNTNETLYQTRLQIQETTDSNKKKKSVRCDIPHGFALIAIFPNSPKNSYKVISDEDSYSSKTLDPYEIFCPSVTSNPVIRDADQDGYIEIFYVVNYIQKFQHDTTMKIAKFAIDVNT